MQQRKGTAAAEVNQESAVGCHGNEGFRPDWMEKRMGQAGELSASLVLSFGLTIETIQFSPKI